MKAHRRTQPRFLAFAALAAAGLCTSAPAQTPMPWDLPPLRYSETPASGILATLAERPAGGDHPLAGKSPLGQLEALLGLLGIPPESQILVFSKTSAQNPRIGPRNPRCLYFNDYAYVGYVPGGQIEVITQDPELGAVFHLIDTGDRPVIRRDTSACFACHGTRRTEFVPGPLVRSVHPDVSGQPLLALGTSAVDHASPVEERWGGYYVTGRSSLPHFGNQTFDDSRGRDFPRRKVELDSVAGEVPGVEARYLRATSDIVALMVLDHQCRVHNLLNAAALGYRRARWMTAVLDPGADPEAGPAAKAAASAADALVDALLFKDEADLGEGIEGDPAYQRVFENRYPRTADGRSLADFQLHKRLFKYRCSYMVYSPAFRHLPDGVRSAVLRRLRERLGTGGAAAPWIGRSEREKITAILAETLPGWRE